VAQYAVKTWGEWISGRAVFLGYKRQKLLASAVGCTREKVAEWFKLSEPPPQMRKGFDLKLATALRTTPSMLFDGWSRTAPEVAFVVGGPVNVLVDAPRSIGAFSDQELSAEMLRRLRRSLQRWENELQQAVGIEWVEIARQFLCVSLGAPVPKNIEAEVKVGFSVVSTRDPLDWFNLPASTAAAERAELLRRTNEIIGENVGLDVLRRTLEKRSRFMSGMVMDDAGERNELLAMLDAATLPRAVAKAQKPHAKARQSKPN
jgi:hypothetical protein